MPAEEENYQHETLLNSVFQTFKEKVSQRPDLNRRPTPYHGVALPAELRWHVLILTTSQKNPIGFRRNQKENRRGSRFPENQKRRWDFY